MHKIIKLIATVALGLAVAACSKQDANTKGTIGIALPSKTEARWVSDGSSIVDSLKKLGYDTDLQYAQYEAPTQLSQIENMMVKGVKALIIAPIDGTTMADVLKQARDKGIKVISYDRLIRNSKDFDYYVTFDNYRTGVLQGQSIVDSLTLKQGKGPFNLEIFAGSTDDNNAHVVYAGVMSQLKPFIDSGKLVVRSGQIDMDKTATPNWDGALAQSRMDNLLSAFYGNAHLDAVLAMNDQIANDVVSSLLSVGYGSGTSAMPIVTGQDAEVSSVKSIIAGNQSSTIFKDTRALAGTAAQMVDAELTGKAVTVNDSKSYNNGSMIVPTQLLTPQLVDRSNWQKILVDDAHFYTLEQLR
ncbi:MULTISPECIES: sugar-binding protein [Pseudomonas syringae group]|uniref:AraF n=2 Tax=Pseudomonas syringae group TaxID=136849 RepID=A0A0P9PBB7_PSESX|nr:MULTISPECIES: sugar-binding protein [Pseudomonas syringae group]KPW81924.1 AraF [Pseudomonas syringae pv. cerasicola]KWS97493.1 sugar ABC transporter substrate-binding protein [Pseudomonas syringae pv. cerasicola]PHN73964.1 sugar ABC transporter substrate-binding protein [Pseudomonas syringae pv. cerasicola]PHN81021.1 sugar ABC transporter substrate-binding protein [Pseudomonas syringae pv. cerasicola]RMS67842.1 AraF [Pseudomonas savastanoi]